MAFTFDSTSGGATANSYVTVEAADDYFTGKFGGEGWADMTADQKKQLLVTATNRIDAFTFGGRLAALTQALNWPRQGLFDREGRTITGIPVKLKQATFELAQWIWTEPERTLSDTDLQQLESYKVGPLDVKVAKSKMVFPYHVEQLLKSIGPGVLIEGQQLAQGGSSSIQMYR